MTEPISRLLRTCLACLACFPAAATLAQDEPPVVFAAAALDVEISDRIEALGTLRANESVTVTATVSDTISKVRFDDGDRVEAGQLLVELTSEEESALLAAALAALDEARSQHERVASLARIGNESKSLLDQRLREVDTARARLRAIEAQLADRLIKAPFAGVVGLRYVSPGSLVQPGDEITTLDDDEVMKMDLPVPAVYLDVLRPSVAVEATSAAWRLRACLVFLDESGLLMVPLLQRSWNPCGQTPDLYQRTRSHQKVSIIAALCIAPARDHVHMYFASTPIRISTPCSSSRSCTNFANNSIRIPSCSSGTAP